MNTVRMTAAAFALSAFGASVAFGHQGSRWNRIPDQGIRDLVSYIRSLASLQ